MKFPLSRYTVSGHSMVPVLKEGSDVLSFNWAYLGRKPKIGDIVVIKVNGKEMVKRVQDVCDHKVLVSGDNKKDSVDSRHFGPVTMDQVIGKVIYRSDQIPCPKCSSSVIGIYGRKDAICHNCGFKLTCCGEP